MAQTLEIGEVTQLRGEFFDIDDTPANPTSVTLTITQPDGTITTILQAGLTHPAVGLFTYLLTVTQSGVWTYRFTGTGAISTGETRYVLVGTLSRSGPCDEWTSVDEVRACCNALPATVNDGDVYEAIVVASDLLYAMSGQQFSGLCKKIIRPCRTPSCFRVDRYGYGWQGNAGYGTGGIDTSVLDYPSCGCRRLSQLDLGHYPIAGIIEVLVDGAVVPANRYRVDEGRFLVHLPAPGDPNFQNDGWPTCQDLDRPVTELSTMQVTFIHGNPPPAAGASAATSLACELAKACAGIACNLPNRVTSIQRQGVSMTLINPAMFAQGLTGLYDVDLFLMAYNPLKHRGGTQVYSPDLPRTGITTTS